MARTFGERLEEEAPRWVSEGIVSDEQAERIVARHRHEAPERGDASERVANVLYGAAAVLLGAAAIALVLVGFEPNEPALLLLGVGLAVAAVGGALYVLAPARRILADAILVGSLAPMAAAAVDADLVFVPLVAGVAAVALLALRYERAFVAPLSLIALTVTAGGGSFSLVEDAMWGTILWTGVMLAVAVGTLLLQRFVARDDRVLPTAVATLALAVTLIPFFPEGVGVDDSVAIELLIGFAMLVAVGIGLWAHDQGVVTGATTALGIDAIVFAFDVGGVLLGVGVLLALAGVLVWQAERLRRYLVA